MFSKRNITSIWKPKNPHSLEYLKYLYGVLNKNTVVTETNRSLLVEALRAIAEILIWGDQNDPSVFDFFLEKNMLGFFLRIMKQKCGRYVCTQLLQTLNILFENISNETSLYYLLSNNHVNSIITHRFDFSDEEILAYYISFLKTLSLKLNSNTIHFFFNEHTNDFPLYTEAIKFFNHSEGMVRIAVRTLTLNVYRVFSVPVNDPAVITFIRDNAAAPYFSNFVFFIANHIADIDSCVSSADSASLQSRDKLADLVGEHLDHIHYMNDVLCLNIDSLNAVLIDQLMKKLFIPIYLASLSDEYHFDGAVRVSPVVALFLLSQVFLVVTHTPLIERLSSLLLLGDHEALCQEGAQFRAPDSAHSVESSGNNQTDEEKIRHKSPRTNATSFADTSALSSRPLLKAVFDILDCSGNDHAMFFAICLIYSIYHNSGMSAALINCAKLSADDTHSGVYCLEIVTRLVNIITQSVEQECTIRIATLEACCATLKQILCSPDGQYNRIFDNYLADLVLAREKVVDCLRAFIEGEDLFLDLFEDEYRQMRARNFSFEFISSDASMLLPPSDTPLSGVDFVKRLPCGPQEHARKAIRVFFLVRELLQDVSGEEDDFDRAFESSAIVKMDDCLNLSNSDLLACTVVAKDGSKCQRFLVTGGLQLMLVEPDTKKLGWGIVRFAGFLQDCEVTGDKEDSRALIITVLSPAGKARANSQQLLSARLIFDDHIRCMAAKQRLTKGRQKARRYKMDVIAHMLQIRSSSETPKEPSLPPPPPIFSSIVGRQVPGYVAVDHSRRSNDSSDNPELGQRVSMISSQETNAKRQASSSRRRVRVLSAESVAKNKTNQSEEKDEGIQMNELSPSHHSDNTATSKAISTPFSFMSILKRSSSLSPRTVPRFGVTRDDEHELVKANESSIADKETPSSGVIQNVPMNNNSSEIVVLEDPVTSDASTPSLQCFAGKKKSTRQVMDV